MSSSITHFESLASGLEAVRKKGSHPPSVANLVAALIDSCAELAQRVECLELRLDEAFRTPAAEEVQEPAVDAGADSVPAPSVEARQNDGARSPRPGTAPVGAVASHTEQSSSGSGLFEPPAASASDVALVTQPTAGVPAAEPVGMFRIEEVEMILEERQKEVDARFMSIQRNDEVLKKNLRSLLSRSKPGDAVPTSTPGSRV